MLKLLINAGCLIGLLSGFLVAQADHSIRFMVGRNVNLSKDRLASPFQYRGWAVPLSLEYVRSGDQWSHEGGLYLQVSKLESKFHGNLGASSHEAELVDVEFHYAFLKKLKWMPGGMTISAGTLWLNAFTLRNYSYADGLEEETVAEVYSSIHPMLQTVYFVSPATSLIWRIHVPLISLTYRNPYSLATDRDGAIATRHSYLGAFLKLSHWTSPFGFFSVDNTLTLKKELTSKWSAELSYGLRWSEFTRPKTSVSVRQQLLFGLVFHP